MDSIFNPLSIRDENVLSWPDFLDYHDYSLGGPVVRASSVLYDAVLIGGSNPRGDQDFTG